MRIALEITFKDQRKIDFNVGAVSTASNLNALFSGFMVDTMSQDLKVSTQQWVTAINMLIALGTQQFTNNFNYCDNCGKALSQAFEFCPFCANPLKP